MTQVLSPDAASQLSLIKLLMRIAESRSEVAGLSDMISWLPSAFQEKSDITIDIEHYTHKSPYAPTVLIIDFMGALIRIEFYEVQTKTLSFEWRKWMPIHEYPGNIIRLTIFFWSDDTSIDLYWLDPPLPVNCDQKMECDKISKPYMALLTGNIKTINDWILIARLAV